MSVFEWLYQQGYKCIEGDKIPKIRLGGKKPDIIAFSDKEIIVFERKKYANELPTAIGQCLHYLIKANGAFIILPEKEIENIPKESFLVLKNSGIGLLADGRNIRIIVDAKKNEVSNEKIVVKLKQKLRSKSKEEKSDKQTKKNKERIIEVLKKHPKGLTIKEIAQLVGIHRINVTKYIYELVGEKVLVERIVGPAKLYYLKVKK